VENYIEKTLKRKGINCILKIHLASCLISNGDVDGTADISVTIISLQGDIKLVLLFNKENVIL
jgi:hypothetical protein